MLLISLTTISALILVLAQQPVDAWWLFNNNEQVPLKATANFDLDGVKGTFKFAQIAGQNITSINYDIKGLKGNNRLYHVHIKPVPAFDANAIKNNATKLAEICSDPATGGHLNPHHITAKLPPKSAPHHKYEVGDLSAKHGPMIPMNGKDDHYVGSFSDGQLPLSGEHSIIGRSLVIHKNDGKRWVCANIVASN